MRAVPQTLSALRMARVRDRGSLAAAGGVVIQAVSPMVFVAAYPAVIVKRAEVASPKDMNRRSPRRTTERK